MGARKSTGISFSVKFAVNRLVGWDINNCNANNEEFQSSVYKRENSCIEIM